VARRRAARVTVDPAMSRLPRIAMAAALLSGLVVAPATAQEPVPDGAVARVGDERIGKGEFRHWMRIAVHGDDQAPREALRESTMLFLLHRAWTRQEAAAQGIVVKPAQVRRAFERQRRDAFPDERAFRRFLRRSGMAKRDLLQRIEFDMLQRRLTRAASADVPRVTREAVDRYYARHRRRFSGLTPARARRTIRVQLTAARRQRAIARFIVDFRSRYRAMTTCAEGYVIDACSNAP
jgi:SurA N-terminal domain